MSKAIRLAGRITEWNDDKGFGFVVPNGGGDRAFVHISEFPRGTRRPVQGDLVSYLPGHDERGRLQARQLKLAGQKVEPPRTPSKTPRAALGIVALAIAGALGFFGLLPQPLALAYGAASLVAYVMYFIDKSAAGRGAQRIPEATLHMASVFGGWPGALIAQQQFRHKTIKQPFQSVFWMTVVANLGLFAWLLHSVLAEA